MESVLFYSLLAIPVVQLLAIFFYKRKSLLHFAFVGLEVIGIIVYELIKPVPEQPTMPIDFYVILLPALSVSILISIAAGLRYNTKDS